MSLGSFVYQNVTRRFSTLFLASAAGAYIMNYTFNTATDAYWNSMNAGKQWKDVRVRLQE
uniref:Complex III subunit 9 n=1 Tax=Heterorhabditis bacteriophora TaxID=37862 RepID=A0A1I7XQ58_HETBA